MERQKWFKEEENLCKNDIVYFKLTDSVLAQDWRLGKVDFVKISRDGKIREVGVSYKCQDLDDDTWKHNVVERPVRSVVKLWNIEDTSLLENLQHAQEIAKLVLDEQKDVNDKSVDDPDLPDGKNVKNNFTNSFSQIDAAYLLSSFAGHDLADPSHYGKRIYPGSSAGQPSHYGKRISVGFASSSHYGKHVNGPEVILTSSVNEENEEAEKDANYSDELKMEKQRERQFEEENVYLL